MVSQFLLPNFFYKTVKVSVPKKETEIKEDLIQGLSEMLLRSEQKSEEESKMREDVEPEHAKSKVDVIRQLIAQKLKDKMISVPSVIIY